MNIPEILRGRSNELDVKAALCRTSWMVFNEDNIRLLFIFENDGSLIVSKNGVVSRQRWSYIRANSTVLIEDVQQQAFLFHPAFIDNVIFALQQDGTQHYLFMIDERQQERLSLSTLQSLNQYLTVKADTFREIGCDGCTAPQPANPQIETDEERKKREKERRENESKEEVRRLREQVIELEISKELSPLLNDYEKKYKIVSVISRIVGIPLMLLAFVLLSIGMSSLPDSVIFDIIWVLGVIIILYLFVICMISAPEWILSGYERKIKEEKDILRLKYLND